MEEIQQTFQGTPRFGGKVPVVISRTGDLANQMTLELNIPAITTSQGLVAWVDDLACALVLQVDLEIGGSLIDRRYGKSKKIYSELNTKAEKYDGQRKLWGTTSDLTTPALTLPAKTLNYFLDFDCNTNIGLSLPMIALQYHEVKITVTFQTLDNLLVYSNTAALSTVNSSAALDASLWVNYIYLDVDERKAYAQTAQEYLFTQLQFTGAETYSQSSIKPRINFNHPCKEFVWITQPQANIDAKRYFDFGDGSVPNSLVDQMVNAKLQFNGQDRFTQRTAQYFNQNVPFFYHTRMPATGIYCYTFALNPEDHQPSGSVNMSRIDTATLLITLVNSVQIAFEIYAQNYNVLRVGITTQKTLSRPVMGGKNCCAERFGQVLVSASA